MKRTQLANEDARSVMTTQLIGSYLKQTGYNTNFVTAKILYSQSLTRRECVSWLSAVVTSQHNQFQTNGVNYGQLIHGRIHTKNSGDLKVK